MNDWQGLILYHNSYSVLKYAKFLFEENVANIKSELIANLYVIVTNLF